MVKKTLGDLSETRGNSVHIKIISSTPVSQPTIAVTPTVAKSIVLRRRESQGSMLKHRRSNFEVAANAGDAVTGSRN